MRLSPLFVLVCVMGCGSEEPQTDVVPPAPSHRLVDDPFDPYGQVFVNSFVDGTIGQWVDMTGVTLVDGFEDESDVVFPCATAHPTSYGTFYIRYDDKPLGGEIGRTVVSPNGRKLAGWPNGPFPVDIIEVLPGVVYYITEHGVHRYVADVDAWMNDDDGIGHAVLDKLYQDTEFAIYELVRNDGFTLFAGLLVWQRGWRWREVPLTLNEASTVGASRVVPHGVGFLIERNEMQCVDTVHGPCDGDEYMINPALFYDPEDDSYTIATF